MARLRASENLGRCRGARPRFAFPLRERTSQFSMGRRLFHAHHRRADADHHEHAERPRIHAAKAREGQSPRASPRDGERMDFHEGGALRAPGSCLSGPAQHRRSRLVRRDRVPRGRRRFGSCGLRLHGRPQAHRLHALRGAGRFDLLRPHGRVWDLLPAGRSALLQFRAARRGLGIRGGRRARREQLARPRS